MQPWWSDERCWNFVPAWKHNPQVKEFLSLGSSDRGLICHCDDALSKSFGPFLSRDKLRKWLQWRWTEQIRQLVTGPRVSLAGQQMPLQLSPRSSSLKHGRRPKSTRFQALDPPRKLQNRDFFGLRKTPGNRGNVVSGCEWLCSPPWCEQPGVDPCYRATGLTGPPPASSGYSWHFTPLPLSLSLSRELHPAADKPQCFCFSMSWIPQPSIARGLFHGGLEVSVNAMSESTDFSWKGWPQLTYWHCSSDLTQFVKLGQNTISRDWRISSWLPLFSCIRYSL